MFWTVIVSREGCSRFFSFFFFPRVFFLLTFPSVCLAAAAVAQGPIRMGMPPISQCPIPDCAAPRCGPGMRMEGLGTGSEFRFGSRICRGVSCPHCVPQASCTDIARRCAQPACPVGQERFMPPPTVRTDRRTGKKCTFPSCPSCRPCLSCPQPAPVCPLFKCAAPKCAWREMSSARVSCSDSLFCRPSRSCYGDSAGRERMQPVSRVPDADPQDVR